MTVAVQAFAMRRVLWGRFTTSHARVIASCALLAALPIVSSSYHLFQINLVIIDAIAILGLNLLTGYGGQISLGHGAFYGMGAYTAAILIHRWNVPYPLTLPCAAIVCFTLGLAFGLPAVRLQGLHLALATFALGVVFPQVLKCRALEGLTGGVQGITIDKPIAPLGLALSADQWLYCVLLAVAAVVFLAVRLLVQGPTGRVIVAIRDRPVAAASVGIDTALYKSLTFGVSAMCTGVAGALGALAVQFVGPDSFSIFLSIGLLVGIVVGGLASISGAVYGALFIQFVPSLADGVSKAAPTAVYGVALIASVHLMPHGAAGVVSGIARRLAARADRRSKPAAAPAREVPAPEEGP
jgi:branched-chain amino acid transport system permease protein